MYCVYFSLCYNKNVSDFSFFPIVGRCSFVSLKVCSWNFLTTETFFNPTWKKVKVIKFWNQNKSLIQIYIPTHTTRQTEFTTSENGWFIYFIIFFLVDLIWKGCLVFFERPLQSLIALCSKPEMEYFYVFFYC